MSGIITILHNIREAMLRDGLGKTGGVLLGKEWLEGVSKPSCLLTPRLTRKSLSDAIANNVKLIITIIPPSFVRKSSLKIDGSNMELLKYLIENKISVYSLGNTWLSTKEGGYDYILKVLQFTYSSDYSFPRCFDQNIATKHPARAGELEKAKTLKDLLGIIYRQFNEPIRFIGYHQEEIQRAVIFGEITDEEVVFELAQDSQVDLTIVGDITFDALLAAKLNKLPLVILTKRAIENKSLAGINRKIQAEMLETPRLITSKLEDIGNNFSLP